MDGSCDRCGQNIPAWLTFTVGKGGRVYCSEYCQRLDEQSRNAPRPDLSDGHPASDGVDAGSDGDGSTEEIGSPGRRRMRFLSRLR